MVVMVQMGDSLSIIFMSMFLGSADELASWPRRFGIMFPSLGSDSVGKLRYVK